jgi:LPS sulfotransferase NodH
VSQAVSFWRAVQTRMWRGRPHPEHDSQATYHAGAIAHAVAMLREQNECWRAWFAEEGIEPIDVPYPALRRNLSTIVATVLKAIGQDPRMAPEPKPHHQAEELSDEWVDRYRDDAQRLGLPD